MTVALSVDVEDWAQSTLDPDMPIYPRAQRNTELLLDIVAGCGAKMTCFILGKFADKFPDTVKRIAKEGHEIASHGYGHVNVYQQNSAQFREDVRRSKRQLEDLTGERVYGYRAPCFSIGKAGNWPFEVLADEGFEYDSSIFPSGSYRNGRADFPGYPVKIELESGRRIHEFPAATLKIGNRVLPVAGGGYYRLLPWPVIHWCIKKSLKANRVFNMYCHPYEFDPDEFRHLPLKLPLKVRLHQGLGRRGFKNKFIKTIEHFETTTLIALMHRENWPEFLLLTSEKKN